jgi:carboxymethylenebutenolidase
MGIHAEAVKYGDAGEFSGIAMWPDNARLPLPAILVIQEAWGVDTHIEDVTRRFAQAGYVALAPDLFSTKGERPPAFTRERLAELQSFINKVPPAVWADPKVRDAELGKLPEALHLRVGESMSTLFGTIQKLDRYVPHLLAATGFLRNELVASRGQAVASVGFCMGGGLSALLACHDAELRGAVIFYGSAPPTELIPHIRCPVVGFYGSNDPRITGAVPAFSEEMQKHGKTFDAHIYEDAPHAFFNDNRPSYHVSSARDAWVRVLEFFRERLA